MPSSIRKVLNELPITLDDTYERILQCIPREKYQHARRLLQCIVAATRPLRVEELAEIFAIEFGINEAPSLVEDWRPENPEEALLSACSTLIAIVDYQVYKTVQFSHFSVKEFLTSDRLQTSGIGNIRDYYVPLEPAHALLARACLTILLQLDEKVDRERVVTFPLVFYAAEHLVTHAKFENVESQIEDELEHLFNPTKPHLRAWTWLYVVENRFLWPLLRLDEQQPPLAATPLYYAASCGFTWLAKHLIMTQSEYVNAKNDQNKAPLYAASRAGQVDTARMLLDHGAHVNGGDDENWTPLHCASWKGHLNVVQLLLEHRASLESQAIFNDTPLCLASERGHLKVVWLLLDNGANVHNRGERDRTPFQVATVNGHLDVAKLLLEYGAERE